MARKAGAAAPTALSVRDELLHRVEAALHALRARNLTDEQIHTARKHLKRARANLRLLRAAVGKTAYARENAALRDAARPLSGVRDAKVLIETADQLIDGTRQGRRRMLLLKARRALEKARREARAELRVMSAAKESATSLHAASTRMRKWRLSERDTLVLRDGLKRTYRRGREAFAIARKDPTPENLHEWRKQVKYLGQSMELWKSCEANGANVLVKRADALADVLGTDHDLVVFGERLDKLDAPNPMRPAVIRSIAGRRCTLQKKALKQGRRLFTRKPRVFVHRIAQSG